MEIKDAVRLTQLCQAAAREERVEFELDYPLGWWENAPGLILISDWRGVCVSAPRGWTRYDPPPVDLVPITLEEATKVVEGQVAAILQNCKEGILEFWGGR